MGQEEAEGGARARLGLLEATCLVSPASLSLLTLLTGISSLGTLDVVQPPLLREKVTKPKSLVWVSQ